MYDIFFYKDKKIFYRNFRYYVNFYYSPHYKISFQVLNLLKQTSISCTKLKITTSGKVFRF